MGLFVCCQCFLKGKGVKDTCQSKQPKRQEQ